MATFLLWNTAGKKRKKDTYVRNLDLLIQGLVTNTAVKAASGANFIQIGSFRATGGDIGSTTTLTLSLQGLVGDPILLDDFTTILPNAPLSADRLGFGSATLSAVPEPSSMLSLGSTLVCVLALRRRRATLRKCYSSSSGCAPRNLF